MKLAEEEFENVCTRRIGLLGSDIIYLAAGRCYFFEGNIAGIINSWGIRYKVMVLLLFQGGEEFECLDVCEVPPPAHADYCSTHNLTKGR